jgi:hypothetical protein
VLVSFLTLAPFSSLIINLKNMDIVLSFIISYIVQSIILWIGCIVVPFVLQEIRGTMRWCHVRSRQEPHACMQAVVNVGCLRAAEIENVTI